MTAETVKMLLVKMAPLRSEMPCPAVLDLADIYLSPLTFTGKTLKFVELVHTMMLVNGFIEFVKGIKSDEGVAGLVECCQTGLQHYVMPEEIDAPKTVELAVQELRTVFEVVKFVAEYKIGLSAKISLVDKVLSLDKAGASTRNSSPSAITGRTLREHDLFGPRWMAFVDNSFVWKVEGSTLQRVASKLLGPKFQRATFEEMKTDLHLAAETYEKEAAKLPSGVIWDGTNCLLV